MTKEVPDKSLQTLHSKNMPETGDKAGNQNSDEKLTWI